MSFLAPLARRCARRACRALVAVAIGLVPIQASYADPPQNYDFVGTVTLCTGTCDSFASLDVGSVITGLEELYVILTTPGGAWSFAGMGVFSLQIFNPVAPLEPYDGTNPTTANPLPITPNTAPIRASGGGLTTSGTTDASNELNSGNILHEFIVPPFSNNGAWIIFDIGANGVAQMRICLFFPTAGCIPGATQAVVADGQFTRIGPDHDGDGICNFWCGDADDDGDGIADVYDTHPLTPNNVCTGGDPDNATLGEMISGDRSCAAHDSVEVQAATHVLLPDGDLRVISELIEIQSGVTVEGKFVGIAKDPCPAESIGCN